MHSAPPVANQDSLTGSSAAPLLPPGAMRTYVSVSVIFLLWGIPNNLNDVLIRQFMKSFEITRTEASLVQFAFYLGYFFVALPAGMLMRRKGYKIGFVTGLLLFSSGCLLFWPAAYAGHYLFFLIALFVLACGAGILETAGSPFVAQLGPAATSEQRLNISAAFNPVGSILGVVVGTLFIFSGIELTPQQASSMVAAGTYATYLHHETLRVVAPYIVLGIVALAWAGLITATKFPSVITTREHRSEIGGHWQTLFNQRHFLFSLLAQFMYVGAQVGTWSFVIPYAREYVHVTDKTAGGYLIGTLIVFATGRIVTSYLMRRFSPSKLMAIYAACNAVLLIFGVLTPGWLGLYAVLLTSFFMSLMFPTIFGLGLKGLGPNTNIAGSLLVMTIIGGALLTLLMGWMADHLHGTAWSYQVPLYGYLVILAFSGYMIRRLREPGAFLNSNP